MNREGILYVLDQLKIKTPLPRAENIQIGCPLAPYRKAHTKGYDSRPSMGISIQDRGQSLVHCFTCRWAGTLERLVDEMHFYGMVESEVALKLRKYIAGLEEVPLEDLLDAVQGYDVEEEVLEDEIHDEALLAPFARKTNRYLLNRGIKLKTIKAWEGGFDRNTKRVTFPVRNWRGQLVGCVGRAVHDGIKPPYMNFWKFSKGRFLFGEHKVSRETSMVVVEGPLDVVSVWQKLAEESLLHKYSVVGLFGAIATMMQIRKLVRLGKDVILFLDNDTAGLDGKKRLGNALQKQVLVRTVNYPKPDMDPDEVARAGVSFRELLESSRLYVETD